MQSAEHDLRHKLLQAELANLMESLDRLEGLSHLDGIWDKVKNAAKDAASKVTKMVTGNKDIDDVCKYLKSKLEATVNIVANTEKNNITVTRNGKTVEVTMDANKKWVVTAKGDTYTTSSLDDLVTKIKVHTETTVAHPGTGDVFRYSRAIIQCKAGPHVRAF